MRVRVVCVRTLRAYTRVIGYPRGGAPAQRSTGHRRKGFSSPGQSNSDDRTHVCGLIGHILYTAAATAVTTIPGYLGFLAGSRPYRGSTKTTMTTGAVVKYAYFTKVFFEYYIILYEVYNIPTYACNIITRCYLFTKWILIGFTCRWLCGFLVVFSLSGVST